MINFSLLETLMSTARNPEDGKPLDKVKHLHATGTVARSLGLSGMRNCKLFKINDTNWRVELHGNTIANITRLDDGTAHVRVSNVQEWPTITTSCRLSSVLGTAVWKQDHKLHANLTNRKGAADPDRPWEIYRTAPFLVNGQMFHLYGNKVDCINPDVVVETRRRIRRGDSKPYAEFVRKLSALATVIARLGTTTYGELGDESQYSFNLSRDIDIDEEIDTALALRLMALGCSVKKSAWWLRKQIVDNALVGAEDALSFVAAGARKLREQFYEANNCYETYTHSRAEEFVCPTPSN